MNNTDDIEIKALIRDVINEDNDRSLIYLENKTFLINNLTDDEEIEFIVKKSDLNYRQDLHFSVMRNQFSFESLIDSSFEKIEDNTKRNKCAVIIEEMIDSIYDEIRFDTFYEMYKEKVRDHVKIILEKKLENKNVLDIEGYVSEPEEVMEILREKGYVIETIFNEDNEGFVGIVKR